MEKLIREHYLKQIRPFYDDDIIKRIDRGGKIIEDLFHVRNIKIKSRFNIC